MSLLKRLLLSVSVAMLLTVVAALIFNLSAARKYLSEQLRGQSENAAVSLALSLSQSGNQDPAVQELLISALFDSGKFAEVRLESVDGQVIFERKQLLNMDDGGVPAWFLRLLPLPRALTERVVSNGWQQLGRVQVQVDNGYAREVLWRSSLQLVLFVMLAGLAWALFVLGLLRWFQRVLQDEVAAQVLQIGQAATLPGGEGNAVRVAELQPISQAIQSAHERVQQQKQKQKQRIDDLELETHSDPVTGLPNRKYFMQELSDALPIATPVNPGMVLLCRIRDLQRMNAKIQRQQVDAWLQGVGEQMHRLMAEYPGIQGQWSRLNGSDFVLMLLPGAGNDGMRLLQQVRAQLRSLNVQLGQDQWSRWAFSLLQYTQADGVPEIMERLDQGIMQAESDGHDVWAENPAKSEFQGQSGWLQLLQEALQHPEYLALSIAVRSFSLSNQEWERAEASLQANLPNGRSLGAALLWPAVVRMGLGAPYDLRAIEMGLLWLQQHPDAKELSVRVSVAALGQVHFFSGLQKVLQQASSGWERLSLEIDAHAVVHHLETALQLADTLHSQGIGLGLRNVEQSMMALLHVQQLRPRYVTVSAHFAQQTLYNTGAAYLLDAVLAAVLAQKGIAIVTEPVSPAAWQQLQQKNLALLVPDILGEDAFEN